MSGRKELETVDGGGRAERCETCRWWEWCRGVSEYCGYKAGYCHRLPPVLHKDPDYKLYLSDQHWTHPIVTSTDWCGEYQPKSTTPGA